MTRRLPRTLDQQQEDFTVQCVPEAALQEQRAAYNALLQSLGSASFEQIEAALASREAAGADDGLTPEVIARLRAKTNNP